MLIPVPGQHPAASKAKHRVAAAQMFAEGVRGRQSTPSIIGTTQSAMSVAEAANPNEEAAQAGIPYDEEIPF